jgi:polar amino acid transport system substrate-binding protein
MTDTRRWVGVLAAGAVTAGLVTTPLAAVAQDEGTAMVSEECQAANIDGLLKNPGRLTLSTDNPAFPPWWGGDPSVDTDEVPWEVSYPPSGEGLEGRVAYAVAHALGFSDDQIDWLKNTEFTLAFQPGPKDFDVHLAQIAIRPDRAENVDFSEPYFDLSQALVAVEGNDITGVTTIDEVKSFNLGVAVGTTALQYVEEQIQPDTEPQVFNNNADAVQALQNGQIDGLIVDIGSSFYVSGVQVENGTIVGQFPTSEQDEQVAFVLEKDSPLTSCIDEAVTAIKESGELQEIYDALITEAQGVPVIE